jgi:hypothetical protein
VNSEQRTGVSAPPRARGRSGLLFAVRCSLCGAALLGLAGCQILGFGGAMVENYKRSSTHTVAPEYKGLEGKRWAVMVQADRVIQADFPEIVPKMTDSIISRLAAKEQQDKIGAEGYIPTASVLRFQYENPGWVTLPHSELAKKLKVDRLIVVDLIEYRLNEPGNQYLWAGLATGSVGVIEADGRAPDEFSFEKSIRVSFPDKQGFGPQDLPMAAVATTLVNRFVDRTTWLFYPHEEPYYPKY